MNPLVDPLVDQIIQRVGNRRGYDGLKQAARTSRWCERPIQLSCDSLSARSKQSLSKTGTPKSSDFEGLYFKSCGTRRRNLCEPCSKIYQGDARQIILAGLLGGKGVSEQVATHPAIFATLTAPSFGPVHRANKTNGNIESCHGATKRRCPHGKLMSCPVGHESSDEIVGAPLCDKCYDYRGAVIWNAASTKLWQRTTIYLRRQLAKLMGLSIKELSKLVRLSYVKVIEYQRRGVVHVHVVIRVDDAGNQSLPPKVDIDSTKVGLALRMALNQVQIKIDLGDTLQIVTWGKELDIREIDADSTAKVANYIAKYATKSASDSGSLDHRFRSAQAIKASSAPKHLRKMAQTAWELGEDPNFKELNLAMWAHDLGHRGHFLTKSKQFSITFSDLHQTRQQWRKEERIETNEPIDEAFHGEHCWHFIAQGWPFRVDKFLVSQERLDREEAKKLFKEHLEFELGFKGVPNG